MNSDTDMRIRIVPEGDSALLITLGNEISPEANDRVAAAARLIREKRLVGITDLIPAYRSILVNYDPEMVWYAELAERLRGLLEGERAAEAAKGRIVRIPVCYGGAYGPDLETVAGHAGISPQEVIRLHAGVDYRIYMLGFLPGFCYLGGLDERLHTPRLTKPRLRIPAGSVGIGGAQTGIYPMESPGGWQLIGRTPIRIYDPAAERPIPYEAGDFIRFVPIDAAEYERLSGLADQDLTEGK